MGRSVRLCSTLAVYHMMTSPTVYSPPIPPQRIAYEWIKRCAHIVWLLTKDDFFTFVGPNTAYGIFAALSGPLMFEQPSLPLKLFSRLHWVIIFNWSNLLIFDLANQRLSGSVQEDLINKPWRPVPSGRMTTDDVRQVMLVAVPVVLAFNHYVLHVGPECGLILILTWLYNDLGGGDQDWVLRNVIIAMAFWLYNAGSAKVAASDLALPPTLSSVGRNWTTIVSLVILTTMHVQDLKDQAGDMKRGRRTAPIVLGDYTSRWTVAISVTFWSLACAFYWRLGIIGLGPIGLGTIVAWRCVSLKGKRADRKTWEVWAAWTALLYSTPFLYSLRSGT